MIEFVDKHHMLTIPEAFFSTLLMANTCPLNAALRVANPAFFPFILGRAGFCRHEYGQRSQEKQHATNRGQLSHRSSPDVQKPLKPKHLGEVIYARLDLSAIRSHRFPLCPLTLCRPSPT